MSDDPRGEGPRRTPKKPAPGPVVGEICGAAALDLLRRQLAGETGPLDVPAFLT
ncbi:MAG: hypothetical protein OXC14_04445 [Rhodospirillaceae bacterium]|nr:hypothetical protein [Rhodospirillaceae bacterium]